MAFKIWDVLHLPESGRQGEEGYGHAERCFGKGERHGKEELQNRVLLRPRSRRVQELQGGQPDYRVLAAQGQERT